MFESIQGILKEKEPTKAILEVGNIGYRLAIPLNTYTKLPHTGSSVFLYLTQVIREDAHTLYAFLEKEQRDLFETLITISGIGPKTALSLVGHLETQEFYHAMTCGDIRLLSKIPGIGKKTAERLVIEMKDKPSKSKKSLPLSGSSLLSDAVSALMNLGYNPLDSQKAVQMAQEETKEILDLGSLIRSALHKIR